MKKRRPRVKNYSSPQRHSHTHEHLPFRAKSSHDSKGRNFKQSYSKLQQNNGYYDNTPCLKKDAFASLESLFDLKKPLNLRNVFPIAFHKQKSFQTSNATKSETHVGPELHVETLFLQSFSPRSNLKPFVLKAYKNYDRVKVQQQNQVQEQNQLKTNEEKEFSLDVSKSVKLQLNDLIRNQQNRSVNMAESEIPDNKMQEEEKKPVVEPIEKLAEDTIVDKESTTIEDLREDQTKTKKENNDKDEDNKDKTVEDKTNDKDEVEGNKTNEKIEEDKTDDKGKVEENKTDNQNKVEESKADEDKGEENKTDNTEKVEGDKTDDKNKVEEDSTNKDNDKNEVKEIIEDESDLSDKPPSYPIPLDVVEDEVTKSEEFVKPIISSSILTDDIITELKVMKERCILLTDEIQQLKREVSELSEKPELTEEDTLTIEEKQNVLMSKIAELEQLTEKCQKAREEIERLGEIEEVEIKERDEPFERILEEDTQFEIPQVQYSEDKLPRIIVCGYTDVLPKLVIADTERKGREKCFEKLTGKLTESLTMQEKLVKENAQLEGGKYKLEEALLEKDTALENLQKKVCSLQAEMRIIVKENMELSRQLATLNQLVIRPTCCYTCPGVTPSPPSTSPALSSRPHALLRDDVYYQCKCCFRSPFIDTLSPTETTCNSPRLTGGGSPIEDRYLTDSNDLQNVEMCSRGPTVVKTLLPRGTCPAELENKLATYGTSTKQLEQQLGSMETEVRNMQIELANVQRERQQLEQQRKLLKCTAPCAPCACCPPPTSTCVTSTLPGLPLTSISKVPAVSAMPLAQVAPLMCTGSCTNAAMGTSTSVQLQQQLRDLREQYARLQDDYKSKLCEVSCMRTEAEKLKQDMRDAKEEKERMEIKLIDVQERLKFLEAEKGKFEGHKEHLIEQEQALMVAKQRFREAQDELEELRSLIQDQAAQLEDYRNKYLQAQQQVEEQRRQLDLMEMDNARMNENVTLEIGRVKNQFQEKLAELAPLPDILKQMQIKMQEAQQMRLVAERSCEDLSRELLGCKDKIQTLQNQLDVLRTEHQTLQDERVGSGKSEEMERKYGELRHENERMKNTLARFEEHEAQLQKRIDEKMHENTQLSSMLEQIREDSARQVARTKERCETMRRSMQGQIAEMERQLAQCRATARAAQRDRDEIRQKMQSQINNLNEAFKHAQGRIKSLQGHVNYLKTSYSNIFLGQGETPTNVLPVDDSCDCKY